MLDQIKILAVGVSRIGESTKYETHAHPFYQLNMVIAGEILFKIGGIDHLVRAGDTVLIPANTEHAISLAGSVTGYYYEVKFAVRSQCDKEMCGNIPCVTPMDTFSPVLAEAIVEEDAHDVAQRDAVETAYLYSILYRLSADYRQENKVQSKYIKVDSCSEVICRVVRYLEDHYWEHLTINDIAKGCEIGKSSLCDKFKRETGTTVFECLMILRVRKAVELLTYSQMTLEQICKATGFVSLPHFNRVFSQYVMIPPGQYRSHVAARDAYWKDAVDGGKMGAVALAVLERDKVDLGRVSPAQMQIPQRKTN